MREFRGDWRDLFHTFRVALDPRKLSLAFLGLAASAVGGVTLLGLFAFAADRETLLAEPDRIGATFADAFREGDAALLWHRTEAFASTHLGGRPWEACLDHSMLARRVARLADVVFPMQGLACFASLLCPRTLIGVGLLVAVGIWCWFVWSAVGGAITRIAAVEIAKDERMELVEALDYSAKNFRSYFWAPLSVLCGILFFAACNVAVGLVLQVLYRLFHSLPVLDGVGRVLVAVLLVAGFPLALLSGFLIILLGVGVFFGWPLLMPGVSAEGTDAFDAVSRAFSYVYGRPWRYLAYHAAAFLYAVPCVLFIMGFACAFTSTALATGGWGMGTAFDGFHNYIKGVLSVVGIGQAALLPQGWPEWAGGLALASMLLVILGLAVSYIPSFALSAWTIMYFLLRKGVDGTALTEVYEDTPMEEVPPPATPPQVGN